MTKKNSTKLRWNTDEVSMTAFSMLCVNGPFSCILFKIVEEVSVEERLEATLPPITICTREGYKKGFIENPSVPGKDIVIPCQNYSEMKSCFEDHMFQEKDVIRDYRRGIVKPLVNAFSERTISTFSLMTGRCVTFQSRVSATDELFSTDNIILNTELTSSLLVHVHNYGNEHNSKIPNFISGWTFTFCFSYESIIFQAKSIWQNFI